MNSEPRPVRSFDQTWDALFGIPGRAAVGYGDRTSGSHRSYREYEGVLQATNGCLNQPANLSAAQQLLDLNHNSRDIQELQEDWYDCHSRSILEKAAQFLESLFYWEGPSYEF